MACFPSEIAILLSDQNYVGSKSVKVPHPLPWRTCNEVDLAPCLSRSLVRNTGFVSNNKVLISKRLVSSSIVPTRHGPAAAGKSFNISHITIPGTALTPHTHTHTHPHTHTHQQISEAKKLFKNSTLVSSAEGRQTLSSFCIKNMHAWCDSCPKKMIYSHAHE